ncbi:hypothetical protein QQ045_033480 [Rhodiola kirilowii]
MEESGDRPFFSCNNCRNPIALRVDLISKNYIAKSGQAYMFSHAMNVVLGSKVDRQMITGQFSVADVYCSKCKETLGWMYVKAYEQKQMYKEGKFILEKMKILKDFEKLLMSIQGLLLKRIASVIPE